jgi:hypothetical protein
VGFGGECGGSRAAGADGAGVWVWNRRAEQLARMEQDWAAPTTAFGTAGAAKWVNRHEDCSTKPRATISINIPAGPCGRPAAEAAKRRLGAHPHWKFLAGEGGIRRASTRDDWGTLGYSRGGAPPRKKTRIIAGTARK